MMRKSLNVFLLLLMGPISALANLCVTQLSARKPHFQYIDYRIEMGRDFGRMRIGGGAFADVFLHFDKMKNQWIVLKKYRPHRNAGGENDPIPFINSDIKAAKILESMSAHHPFRVLTYTKHREDPHVVEIEYQAGVTLEQVLINQKVSAEDKKSMVTTYERGLQNLFKEMQIKYGQNVRIQKQRNKYNEDIVLDTLIAEIPTITGTVNIWIKPDNILVDPYTLNFILIDPH